MAISNVYDMRNRCDSMSMVDSSPTQITHTCIHVFYDAPPYIVWVDRQVQHLKPKDFIRVNIEASMPCPENGIHDVAPPRRTTMYSTIHPEVEECDTTVEATGDGALGHNATMDIFWV